MDARFFGDSPGLFGILQACEGARRSHSLVICPPLLGECVWTYWALRQIAQRAATAGYDVFRFDFSGCGNSLADSTSLEVSDWRGDVSNAIDIVAAETGNAATSLLSVRFSFAFAAAATLEREVETLIAWDPVVSGAAWLADREEDREEHNDGTVDYQGYTLRNAFVRELRETEARAVDCVQTIAVTTAGHRWDRPPERFGVEEFSTREIWNWRQPVPALFFAHDSIRLVGDNLS